MELLNLLNRWWKEGRVSKELALPYKRKVFPKIKELLKVRQIIILSGLRRVGKSTLMYQLIEDLLNSGINPKKILYFSFDERIESPLDILNQYAELTGVDWKTEKCFILFDEIQKSEDWSNKIKIIYDNFPNLKLIISGSSSFQLEKEAKMNLVGRHFVLNVPPLSFAEYLELKGSKIELSKPKLWESEIKKEFESYLLKPFPEIVGLEEPSLVKAYIKDSVIEKVLKIDLATRFKRLNKELLTRLIDLFYDRPGTYVNYDELARELSVSKKTLIQHIYYLELAYVLRRIKNFRPRARIASRKLQRAYPFHWSLGFGWTGKLDFETIVASVLDAKYYWRKGDKEVDFLIVNKSILPVEVKESTKVRRPELKPLLFFMKKFGVKEALLVYKGGCEETRLDKLLIKGVPIWKLVLGKY